MFRLSLSYVYKINERLQPLTKLEGEQDFADVWFLAINGRELLEEIFNSSVFGLKTSRPSANRLYDLLGSYVNAADDKWEEKVPSRETAHIAKQAQLFEIALNEELSVLPTYIVTPKGGYNVDILTLSPKQAFPPKLTELLSEASYDVEQAGKCLAFEVPTAAAFHLHKLNELVVQYYYKAVTNNAKKPDNPTLGNYLKAMRDSKVGEDKILAVEAQIKNLHRNPVIHPEENLEVQDAIELFGIIVSAISSMLPTIEKYQESEKLAETEAEKQKTEAALTVVKSAEPKKSKSHS